MSVADSSAERGDAALEIGEYQARDSVLMHYSLRLCDSLTSLRGSPDLVSRAWEGARRFR